MCMGGLMSNHTKEPKDPLTGKHLYYVMDGRAKSDFFEGYCLETICAKNNEKAIKEAKSNWDNHDAVLFRIHDNGGYELIGDI